MAAAPALGFRPMTEADIPLVVGWMAKPHVAAWWSPDPRIGDEFRSGLKAPWMRYFLITADGDPFMFLQAYDIWEEHACAADYADAAAEGPYDDQPQGTVGIDQFIGPEGMLNRGLGSAAVRLMVDHLLAEGAPRVVTDPDPANPRAVRAYEKARFRRLDERDTPDGRVVFMVREG